MSLDVAAIRAEVNRITEVWTPSGIRTILVWGSTIDVLNGVVPRGGSNDVDIMVICENSSRIASGNVGLHGMPTISHAGTQGQYDCSLLDVGYVRQSLSTGRWTVVRAIREGVVLRDDGLVSVLAADAPQIEPFQNTTWQDWHGQARKLLPKAAKLIEEGNPGYAELLLRNAAELLAYAHISRSEGSPPTPSNLHLLASKHASSDPVLANIEYLLAIDGVDSTLVKERWLQLSEIMGT